MFRRILPEWFLVRLSAEEFGIRGFMKFAAQEIERGARLLDAGAGDCPYRAFFEHAAYESTDWQDGAVTHDFTCDLHRIPRPDNVYDAVICTQVLNHVESPQRVVSELARILKPGGRLFLTMGQGWRDPKPGVPFHNFTNYDVTALCRNAGLRLIFLKPRGGIFWRLGHDLQALPEYVIFQYLPNRIALLFLVPFYLVGQIAFGFFVPLAFHYLDRLDKLRTYTLGYACYCVKEPARDRDS
jgi:SAM-dependent methyltransferase